MTVADDGHGTHLSPAAEARIFLSATSLERGHLSTSSQALSSMKRCCGQECPGSARESTQCGFGTFGTFNNQLADWKFAA